MRLPLIVAGIAAATLPAWLAWRWASAPERVYERVVESVQRRDWRSVWREGMRESDVSCGLSASQYQAAAQRLLQARDGGFRLGSPAPLASGGRPTVRQAEVDVVLSGRKSKRPLSFNLYRSPQGWVIDEVELLFALDFAVQDGRPGVARRVAQALLAAGADVVRRPSQRLVANRGRLLASPEGDADPNKAWQHP